MSNVVALITALKERDIRVSLNGDKLKVSAPAGALTDDLKQQLQIHKEDLLDFLRHAQSDSGKSAITVADRNGLLPLSYSQQRLWILDKIQPNLAAYNMPMAFRVRGAIDVAAMQRTFRRIVERHEVLRARLYEHEGIPAQRIADVPDDVLQIIDNPVADVAQRDGVAETLASRDAQTPFALLDAPLFRASLTRLGDDDYVLLANMHHIVSDGWSVDVLFRDLGAIYASEAMGLPANLAPLSVHYVDFAAWQRAWLDSDAHLKQLDYWKNQFKGAPSLLKLPTDRPRPAQQTFNGDDYDFEFGADLSAALKRFCQQHNVTLFSVLLAAYQLVLSRYAQQDDIAVAIPSAGRNRRELEGLIGFFVNVLIMRTKLAGNLSVLELVRNVKATALAGFANEDIPMEKIIEAIDIDWNPAYPPLAQVGFAFQNIGSANPNGKEAHTHTQLGNLRIDGIGAVRKSAKYDMIFFVTEGEEFGGSIEYNTDLFDRATIERLARHVKQVLAQMLATPQAHVASVAIASDDELLELLELPVDAVAEILPLTATHKDLYLAHIVDPDTLVNSMGQTVELTGNVDVDQVRAVAQRMVDHYAILRAHLVASPAPWTDVAYWIVNRHHDADFRYSDWSAEYLTDDAIQTRLHERIYQPYDIHDALYHFELIRITEQRFIFVVIGNHIVFDGIAMRSFNQQLVAQLTGTSQALAADNLRDYIPQALESFDTDANIAFWRAQLGGCEPLDIAMPATNFSKTLLTDHCCIEGNALSAIERFCASSDVSLPRLFKALYGVLINAYGRADGDFQIRDTLAGRGDAYRDAIGCFHQIVPFVFPQALLQPQTRISELFEHARSFPRSVREHAQISLMQQRRLSETGRCGFMYNFYTFETPLDFHGTPAPITTYPPLEVEGQVQLIVKPMGATLQFKLYYYEHLFPNLRFLERLIHVAQQVAQGAQTLAQLSLVLPDEHATLAQWNPPGQVFEQFAVHQRFEQMAEQFADRIALSCDGAQWTYRELNARANQIAHALIGKGVQVGDFVGLSMERSLDLMAGILGILKANAAYVPLDPHFPPERLAFILEDSQARVLVTHAAAGDGLADFNGNTLMLERDADFIAAQPTTNPYCYTTPASTIYVLYTSGTTGRPKGCVVTHGNVARLMTATEDDFHFNEHDVWTLFHSYAFDFTVWEMWGALLYGGKLVVVPYLLARSPNDFYELLLSEGVTALSQTPSAFSQLIAVDAARSDVPALALRYVVFGGEALDFNALRTWVKRHGLAQPKLVNMYGITETTVHVTRYTLTQKDFEQPGSIVGKPIRDLHVHIVDRHGKPTPIGIPGEMRIAGPGVTNGYLKRDDLTAERFTPNGFSELLPPQQQAQYSRLYHSGDLARFTPDGDIEYLGRIDLQVKIRGHRIELGEIMAQLAALDDVREAVVVVREDTPGDQRLAAYLLLPEGQKELDLTSVRNRLKVMLPDYMVPSHFIVLDAWPLTPTGKVDKKALPIPESEVTRSSQYVAPVSATEQRLCVLWADMLGVDQVGIDDNFFELGGHSLLAARLGNEITKQFGKALPLRILFVEPTVRALARALDGGELGDDTGAIAIADRSQPLPLSFNQLRLWFVQKLGGVSNVFNISTAVRIHGAIDIDALRTAFGELVQQHESLRTRFASHGDDVYQLIDAEPDLSLPLEQLTVTADGDIVKAVRRIADTEAARAFDMTRGPLWRVRLLHIGENDHALVMCIHHIITDGLSLQMLLAEVGERYAARIANRSPMLLPNSVQYADFAAWQRQRLDGEKLQQLLGYWERQLAGAPTLLNLPTDRARPKRQTFNGDVFKFALDATLAGDLKTFCRQHNVTSYVVLLSALQLLLARYARQNDICVGSAVSGRIRAELQNVLGFFANTVVMRTRFTDNPSVLELIDDVKNTVIGAMEHQELPFEQLVDHLKIPRSLAHSPLYQVAFTMTQMGNDAGTQQQFGGLQFEAIGNTQHTAQVDLTLGALESDAGIDCGFEYNTDLFERNTIEALARNFAHIVRSMLRDTAQPTQTIELVPRDALYSLLQLSRDDTQHIAPLTSTLRDLYLAHVINPATEINSLGQYVIIDHAVDVERLRAAAQSLVDATDVLRARFVACSRSYLDDVYMVVDKQRQVDFTVTDIRAELGAVDTADSDAELRAIIERLIYVPYDIHSRDLYRFELLQLAPTRFALVLIGNHILFDGVSSTSCLKQVLAFYENGEANVFAGNGFFEYIDTARNNFDTRSTHAFWRQLLATVEPLNFSKPSNDNGSGFISRHDVIDHAHIARVQQYCDANGLTLPRYFRSLYGVLIREYCRSDANFLVRDTLAGRERGHERTLGCYHRLVPFVFEHTLFNAGTPLSEFFAYSAGYVSRVREHSRISLVQQRRLTEASTVGFMFNFYQFDYRMPFEGDAVALEFLGPIAVDGEVQLILERIDDHLRMHLHYPAAIFDDLRLLERLRQLSQQVLDGASSIGDLSLLLPDELAAMRQWSSAAPQYTVAPVHQRFEQMAAQHGERIAVTCDGVALNYRELNARANHIAHALIEAGAGVGKFVGLCMDRSNDLMAALLGILKTGAAYVPLDPHFPADRLQFIIEDADCALLLTSSTLHDALPQYGGRRLFVEDIATSGNDFNPQTSVTADDIIYVLYTSGTTGKPKGCLVTHANVSRLFSCTDDFFGFNHHDVWTLFHSYAFDFTVWEMWGALLYGGKLVIVPHAVSRAPDLFYQLLIDQKVTVLNQTPSAFSQLIAIDDTHPEHMQLALRYVVFGGEALDFNALRTWRKHHDLATTRLVNMYGITETTVHVTLYLVHDDDLERGGSIIGKPIGDLHTHIVNDRGQRQPIGIPGEILVAGPGVTRGYLKRDDLTAQRFIANPFAVELPIERAAGYARLYRSGDLGRYRADGDIDYLGRIDFQVKIRGHRIELGEIEHRMAQLERVREAIVLVAGNAENKQLIGYMLCDGLDVDTANVRVQLSQQLPDYMIPAAFVVVTEWPLTPTGKVDKKALPAPESALGERSNFVAPRTDIEIALALTWEQLLGVANIGIHDNFFFIGGHSLIAVKLMSRLREQFDIELPLRTLFEQPTIEQLAVIIASSTSQSLLPPITPVDHSQPLPLSFNQQRLWFVQQMDPTSNAYNMPVALRIRGVLEADALEQSFRLLIERHSVLRTRFISIDDVAHQQIDAGNNWQLHRVNAGGSDDTAVAAMASQLAAQPFDLGSGTLLRATLIQLGDSDHVLVTVMHHIASDGWSMQLMVRELASLYASLTQGATMPLPDLPIQYADFAAWQRQYLRGEYLEAQLAWWREQLSGAPRLLNLPTDRPRPPVQSDRGAAFGLQLPAELTQQVHAFAKQHQLTPFMVMLAAYQLLLGKYAGQNDVCVGIPIAGRHQRETENLVGFFVNALIVRARMDDNPRVRTLLTRVKDSVLGAFAHQDVPTETIIEHLNVPRSLAYSPIAQVGFNYMPAAQVQTPTSVDLGALSFEAIDSGFVAAKYDMIWSFADDGNEIRGGIEYRTDLFDAATVARMADHYQQLLSALLGAEDCSVSTLQWLQADALHTALGLDARHCERIEIATAMQRDLYLDTVLNPENRRDYLGTHLDLHMAIDIDKWRQATELLHVNSSALRTRIVSGMQPWLAPAYAVVSTPQTLRSPFEFIDLRGQSVTNEDMLARIDTDVFTPYTQADAPWYRFRLYQLADEHFIAVLAAHHAVADGVGFINGMLMPMLADYEALVRGETPKLANDQFGDYYAINHSTIDTEDAIAHWREAIAGVEPLTAYVAPANAGRSGKYHQRVLRVDVDHWHAITHYCREHHTTPALYLKALFSILLASHCNAREDFYFCEITVGRPKSHATTVGLYFLQTPFIVRKDVIGADNSIDDLLAHISRGRRQMRDGLQLSNTMQHSLLPQSRALTLFNFYPMPMEFDVLGHKVESWQHIPEMDNCINLVGRVSAGELDLLLTYTDNVFTDNLFLERIVHLSKQLVAGTSRLGDLTLTFASEQPNLLEQTHRPRYSVESVQALFENQVVATPEAVAVEHGNSATGANNITYAALNRRANQLAHYLRQHHGVERGDIVGCCFAPGIELMVAILGAIKAGAAYVPMDANYPPERLAYMLRDSNARVLLSESCLEQRLPEADCARVMLDNVSDAIASMPQTNPVNETELDDLLYVIYTSGSTGRPKGAGVKHRGELNLLAWYVKEFRFNRHDNFLIISAIGFDLTQKNLFAPLVSGGRVVMPEGGYDDTVIRNLIEARQISVINCAPSAFYPLVENASDVAMLNSLRLTLFGGEPIRIEKLLPWFGNANCVAQVVNMYGPTECTDISTFYRVVEPQKFINQPIPIGKANDNVQLYVVDAGNRLLPAGVPGELLVGGEGVGVGYLGKPDLTQKVFIDNPFGEGTLYRTGDLVREVPNGNLEFISRIDFQIKLRGLRIELGEIEFALRQLAGVSDAQVLVRDERLVAYVTAAPDAIADLTASPWRATLARYLPDYMVPQALVALPRWPLTPNGKIDRNALPSPDADSSAAYVAPRNATEEKLAALFAEVLGLERVGIHDDFFALGGHSLLATRVVARIRDTFNAELPLRELFNTTSVAGLAQLLDRSVLTAAQPPIVVVDRSMLPAGRVPLSFAQQRLWLIDQIQNAGEMYNIPLALRIQGTLNVDALTRAFAELVARHETLRTTIGIEGDEAFQRIHDASEWQLEFKRSDDSIDVIKVQSPTYLMARMNLAQGPLFRARLIEMGDKDHVLMLVMHHIISDGWSMDVLLRELVTLYLAYDRNQPSPLLPLDVQYADFAVWQRNYLQGDVLDAQINYWRNQLADVPLLELPSDHARQALLTAAGGLVEFTIDAQLTAQLQTLSREHGATMFMTLMAAFQALLHRYSGQDDIAVGTPIANRTQQALEPIIGFFVNTLVIRGRPEREARFVDFLDAMRKTTLDAYMYQDVSFERLIEALNIPRNLSHTPLFQVMFMLQNIGSPTQSGGFDAGDIRIEPLSETGSDAVTAAKFDITLTVTEGNGSMNGVLEYRRALFERATIERMAQHFTALLTAIVAAPATPIGRLPMLTAQERALLVTQWNQTVCDYPRTTLIHQLIEQQTQNTPSRIAVSFGDEHWNFAELNTRANQIARQLMAMNIDADTLVGVCLERSLHMVAALLGVLKAGCAYVPIDPQYPQERTEYVIENAQLKVLITQQSLLERLPTNAQYLCVDRDAALLAANDAANLPVRNRAEQPMAYAIYTSGSTGKPKGVAIPQQAFVNFLYAMDTDIGMNEDDVLLAVTTLSFDIAGLEIFLPLLKGAQIVIASRDDAMDDRALVQLIEQRGITYLQATPATWHLLVNSHWRAPRAMKGLCGGEPLPPKLANELLARGVDVYNVYGPTETTVWSSLQHVAEPVTGGSVSIGRPIANTSLFVLDDAMNPVPVGVAGELYIGGDGVAFGYLGRPDLTDERFIANPFRADDPTHSEKIYRTGDLARYLPDGRLECLGRIDNQVKVRGFRIELGEIETVLNRHPAVREGVVHAIKGDNGNATLAAYLVARGDVPDANVIKAHLRASLPEYMVPGSVMFLDAMPLTPNGKVDRKALPKPQAGIATTFIAPRTPTETALAQLFAEVLGIERIGIDDDFFELGGQSLIATQLVARIRRHFDIDLGLREIFEKHTVADLAVVVETKLASGARALPPLTVVDRNQLLPLSYTQHRLWVLDKLSPGSAAYNMASAFRIRGALNADALRRAFVDVIERHESLRFSYGEQQGEPYLIINDIANYGVEQIDMRGVDAASREAAILRAAQQHSLHGFDLARGPLIICTLITIDDDDHALLINLHHTVADGLSLPLMLREIGMLYLAYSSGQPIALPPLPVQYADFAYWQRQWLTPERLQSQIDYWSRKLSGAPELLNLPTDKPRPPKMSGNGASVEIDLGADLAQQIAQFARERGVTPFIVLLTAFNVLLSRYSQQKDICIGIPIAGRNDAQLEPLIGLFLGGLVIRTDLSGNPTALQMIERVRNGVMEDFAHQDAPIDKVLETLDIIRSAAYPPLTQVGFQVLNNELLRQGGNVPSTLLPNLTVDTIGTQHTTARYDITLNMFHNDSTLSAGIEYNTDIFVESTVVELVQRLGELTRRIITEPHTPISKIDIISPQELLAEINASTHTGGAKTAATPARYSEVWPLTAMQTDMVIDGMINPHSLQSSHGWAIDIRAPMDVALWQRCCQEITDSQRLLRARIVRSDKPFAEVAYLAIEPHKQVNWEFVDLSGQSVDVAEVKSELKSRICRPFDVFNDELAWFALYKISDDHFISAAGFHHALLDGFAMQSVWIQVTSHYTALAAGESHAFTPDNFDDYVAFERQEIDRTEVRDFWREKLARAEPLDFTVPSPVPAKGDVSERKLTLDVAHWKAIRQYCRKQRITPALYFKSLFGVIIDAYCRPDTDFVMYEMMAGRSKEFATSLGCYIQQTPVVFDKAVLAPANDFSDVLEFARAFQKEAKDQRMVSVGALLEMVPRGRIGVRFNYYHFFEPVHFLGHTYVEEGEPSDPDNNIEIAVSDFGEHATVRLYFHGHLFADFGMLERLVALSVQIVEQGITRLGDLQLVSADAERQQMLQAWNATAMPFDLSLCLHQRFELQCVRTPKRLAIADDNAQYSYEQLNVRANQLARHLQSLGIKRGDLVGICLERSADFLVAILATFKAGGAYVPMDAKYPDERIAYMRDNSQARVIVSHTALLEKVGSRDDLHVVALDRDWSRIALLDVKNVFGKCDARDFAYMIYTSGSTGLPKGALIRHDGAVNHIEAERAVLDFAGDFSFLQTAPSSSDISVWQFLGPVTCGGAVIVLDEVTNAPKLFELVQRFAINLVELVPVALQLLMEHIRSLPAAQRALPQLKWMMATGEAVPVDMVNAWLALYPSIPVVNAYGPTEAADDVIQCAISEPLESGRRSVPIGKPLANMQVYILDNAMRLVPPGVPGEICISGVGVGGGYWHNADKTASAFVSNPFATADNTLGDTIYRTGDLGRWLADGTVEYLDRVDNQVKVRGYRIELGEVEAALGSDASVRECAVIVRDDMPGGAALVGYVIAHADAGIDSHTLRAALRARLPDYMVPATLVVLERMPLTPAGKIDRKALPAPVLEGRTGEEFVAARNDTEATLCQIWQEVLGVPKVGVNDNFFELGGHSLLAVRLLSRVETTFGSKIPLATLFAAQTVAQLADVLMTGDNGWSPLVPIRVVGDKPPLFIVHAFGGMVLNYDKLAQALPADQPVYGVQAFGFEPGQQAFENLEAMAAFYRTAIQKKQPHGPYYMAGHSFGGIIAQEIVRQFEQEGEAVAMLTLLDSFVPQPKQARQIQHDVQLLQLFVENNFGDVDVPWRLLQRLDHDALLDEVLKALGGIVNRDFLEAVLRVSRGFITMQTRYVTRAVSTPITLLRPRGSIANPLMKLGKLIGKDELMGVDKLTRGGVTLREVDGDHYRMLAEPAVRITAAALEATLRQAQEK